jgi:hypothetical protein
MVITGRRGGAMLRYRSRIVLLAVLFVGTVCAKEPVGICPKGYIVKDGYCVLPKAIKKDETPKGSCDPVNAPKTDQTYTCIPATKGKK